MILLGKLNAIKTEIIVAIIPRDVRIKTILKFFSLIFKLQLLNLWWKMEAENPVIICENKIEGTIRKISKPNIKRIGDINVPYPIPKEQSTNSQIKAKNTIIISK